MGGVCCGSGELLSAEARAALEEERVRSQELEKKLTTRKRIGRTCEEIASSWCW